MEMDTLFVIAGVLITLIALHRGEASARSRLLRLR